jgi:hypothetical protein
MKQNLQKNTEGVSAWQSLIVHSEYLKIKVHLRNNLTTQLNDNT